VTQSAEPMRERRISVGGSKEKYSLYIY